MGPSEQSCCEKYFKNASPQRLTAYFVILIAVAVFLILLFTFIPVGGNGSGGSGHKPQEVIGSDVLKMVPLIDGNNDLPWKIYTQLKDTINDFTFISDDYQTDLNKLKAGMVGAQVWTVGVPCDSQYKDATARALQQFDVILRLINKFPASLKMATSYADIVDIYTNGHVANLIGIKGGHLIDNKLAVLRSYYYSGARYLTLTSGCTPIWLDILTKTTNPPTAVSNFGEAVIKEMNRLGMLIDLAYSNPEIQNAVLTRSTAPVIFSTAVARAVTSLDSGLTDEILKKVKEKNGLVMISFDPSLYSDKEDRKVTIHDVAQNIGYIKEIIGTDHVGIGTAYNNPSSSKRIEELEDSSAIPKLFNLLAKPPKDAKYTSWTQDELKKLAGQNFLRVLQAAEQMRDKLYNEKPNENFLSFQDIPTESRACYSNL